MLYVLLWANREVRIELSIGFVFISSFVAGDLFVRALLYNIHDVTTSNAIVFVPDLHKDLENFGSIRVIA